MSSVVFCISVEDVSVTLLLQEGLSGISVDSIQPRQEQGQVLHQGQQLGGAVKSAFLNPKHIAHGCCHIINLHHSLTTL